MTEDTWDETTDDPEAGDPDAVPHPADCAPEDPDAWMEERCAELGALQLRRANIMAVARNKAKNLQERYAYLLAETPNLRAWVSERIRPGKRSWGRLEFLAGFRARAGGLTCPNPDALEAWCVSRGVDPSYAIDAKSTLSDKFAERGGTYYLKETGEELPPEVAQFVTPHDEFYVAHRRVKGRDAVDSGEEWSDDDE